MIHHKRSTVLAVTLLSITISTTGCIQKQDRVIKGAVHQAPQQQLGAKTVPYTQPAVQYTQPIVQQIQPAVQYTQPIVQQTQPAVQYTQPIVQQTQPAVPYTQPIIQQTRPAVPYTQPIVQQTQPTVQYVEPAVQQMQPAVQYVEPTSQQYTELEGSIEEEGCSDDVVSNCDRGSIDKSQLSSNYSEESFGGTVHSFKSVQGSSIKIGERKNGFTFPTHPGKVIILEMFGQTCPHCIKEIPILKQLKSRYGNRLEVIGIHSQGVMGKSAAKRFIGRHRVNYPIIDSNNATDLQYFIQNTYGWTGILPFTMVIKDGVTEGSVGGEASYRELKEIIDPLL